MTQQGQTLAEAEFNPTVRWYWLLSGTIVLTLTIVGILFIPLFWILGLLLTGRYLARLRCTLTPRALKVEKGLLVRVEKTIPLDKITDLGLVEGPIMRALGLQALAVETAGQTQGPGGALVKLTGIVDARGFRDRVLEQRDRITGRDDPPALPAGSDSAPILTSSSESTLREISDTLRRIEAGLADRG